jgi:hypothetical protein
MPDFGIMRGFNEKLFGDKLYAGQLPTQLGLIGSSDFGIDPDAQAFFDRVTAAGGSLSATEKSAVNTLVVQMKADGTWTPMKAIYPMVGASAAACSRNLKADEFNGTFTSTGWTFASTGATPNGTSAYMNTNFIPSLNTGQDSLSFSYYSRTNNTFAGYDIGAQGNASAGILIYNSGLHFYSNNITANTYSTLSASNSIGHYISNRISSGTQKLFKNGSVIHTANTASVANININMYLGAFNFDGSVFVFTNRECAFSHFSDGLTDTQASDFYTAVQAFQTTLSRQV